METCGHLEVIRCNHCDWAQHSTVYPVEDLELIGDASQMVLAQIEWSENVAKSNEIAQARQLFGVLANIPTSALLRSAKLSPRYSLGTYPIGAAITLQNEAKSKGIVITFAPAE